MRIEDLEDAIQIKAWGAWVHVDLYKKLGEKPQRWAMEYLARYPEPEKIPLKQEIQEDYAKFLDGLILRLGKDPRKILVGLYSERLSDRSVANALRMSRYSVRQMRDSALNQLYGMLSMIGA